MKPDEEFNKQFDLEPTEYRREDQPEPFLGFNGRHFLIMFALSFPVTAIIGRLVYGGWPYWLQWLLE